MECFRLPEQFGLRRPYRTPAANFTKNSRREISCKRKSTPVPNRNPKLNS